MDIIFVSMGAVSGALVRWQLNNLAVYYGLTPWVVMLINITGSFAIGIVSAVTDNISGNVKLFLASGFCGAYTTFSTYSLDVVELLKKKQYAFVVLLVFGSNILSIGATALALKIFSKI